MKNICFALSAICFLTLTGCSQNNSEDNNQSVSTDRTAEVLAKVGGNNIQIGTTSLTIAESGTFELLYDARVRYFPPNADPNERPIESSAYCGVKISGTTTFASMPERTDVPISVWAEFIVQKADVVSSTIHRDDQKTVLPAVTCARFAESLVKTRSFEQAVVNYGADFITFLNFEFGIYDSSSWLFNSQTREANEGGYNIRRANYEYVYLVKPGSKIDAKDMVLADLDGQALETNNRESKLSLNAKNGQILISNAVCAVAYQLNVKSIYIDSEALKGTFDVSKTVTGTPTGNPESCARLETSMQNIGKQPTEFRYISNMGGRFFLSFVLEKTPYWDVTMEFHTPYEQ